MTQFISILRRLLLVLLPALVLGGAKRRYPQMQLDEFLEPDTRSCHRPALDQIYFAAAKVSYGTISQADVLLEPRQNGSCGDERAPLFYTRIPKTGSTMLRNLVSAHAENSSAIIFANPRLRWRDRLTDALVSTRRRKSQIRMYTPHTAYGLHFITRSPCCYVTVLRDPFQRMVSLYYESFRKWHSLPDFLQGCNNSFVFHNLQTVQICGYGPECTRPSEALAIARRHLQGDCYTFGVLEDIVTTLDRFHIAYPQLFSSTHVPPPVVRKTSRLTQEPQSVQRSVEALRPLYRSVAFADYALWDFATKDLRDWAVSRGWKRDEHP